MSATERQREALRALVLCSKGWARVTCVHPFMATVGTGIDCGACQGAGWLLEAVPDDARIRAGEMLEEIEREASLRAGRPAASRRWW